MFWDSSAIVPLLVGEEHSVELTSLLATDASPAVFEFTAVECASALYRRRRQSALSSPIVREALQRLEAFCEDATQVSATEVVRKRAMRLLATHPLRAGDALQLAAALVWCQESPQLQRFVSLDDRLREAAGAEGFWLIPEEI
jgi:predicted nucleic acid-binding protein